MLMDITVIEVDKLLEMEEARRIITNLDVTKVLFRHEGKIIEIPVEELDRWKFTGLGLIDFVKNREWKTSSSRGKNLNKSDPKTWGLTS